MSSVKRARRLDLPALVETQAPEEPGSTPSAQDTDPACNATPRGSQPASVAPLLPAAPAEQLPLALNMHLVHRGTGGCSDVALWCGLWQAIQHFTSCPVLLLPPKIATELERLPAEAVLGWRPEGTPSFPTGQIVLAPFVHQEHWTLLILRIMPTCITAATVLSALAGRELRGCVDPS